MKPTRIAVDLAKNVFELAVSDRPGKIESRHRFSRAKFLRFFAQRPSCTVILEACGSSHHWARELTALGHRPVLLSPQYVRPYVRRNKSDRSDAEALLEAHRDRELHPVPVKSVSQQTLCALHRLRSRWLATRTSRINTVRGLLRELGIFIPVGASQVVPRVWELVEDADSALPEALRQPLAEACSEIRDLSQRVKAVEAQLRALAAQTPAVERLQSIPGIGLLTSTALVGFVGDARRFASGRHLASYLGLTPREWSSGSVRRLGRISKRGNRYLRMLLIHGARAALQAAQRRQHPSRLQVWALRLQQKRGHNKAAVALANKMARITWAVWRQEDRVFQATAARA